MIENVCGHWSAGDDRFCGSDVDVRRYLPGLRCPDHTPARLAGHAEASPNPDHTMEGLRRTWYAERGIEFVPSSTPVGDTLIDQRAVASGKRRSSPNNYRAAQAATDRSS